MPTYEMLWDCPFCGTRKLLGKTHRHCPTCGAPQDPSHRYFPSDAEKVAVEDHVFVGADRLCPACANPMSARATHCTNCGSPMDGSAQVARRADQVGSGFAGETEADARREIAARQPAPPSPPKKKTKPWKIALGVAGCLGCAGALGLAAFFALGIVATCWTEPVSVTVTGHSWSREIEIEEYAAQSDSAWCDSKPSDAYDVSKKSEVRSHDKVPTGETCTTRRIDNGDGTFTEREECTTQYRDEPVYDDKCYFKVNRWVHARTLSSGGKSLSEKPVWPSVDLAKTGQVLGAEREGKKGEKYTVLYSGSEGKIFECEFDEPKWSSIPVGSTWTGESGVLTGSLVCDKLVSR